MAASSSRFANVSEEFLDELLSVACFCHFNSTDLLDGLIYAKTIRLLVLVFYWRGSIVNGERIYCLIENSMYRANRLSLAWSVLAELKLILDHTTSFLTLSLSEVAKYSIKYNSKWHRVNFLFQRVVLFWSQM